MAHGVWTAYAVTMASGATLTPAVDLGRAFCRIYIDPTGAASEVRFQAASSLSGTYRQVYLPQPNTSTVQANAWKVASAVSGGVIEGPGGLRFVKVETTAGVANGLTFVIYASDL